ncbi:MAG TPA: DUF1269 domain-containing protein [Chloroflexota bacterium]|jgi:uncharacterized membrane protein
MTQAPPTQVILAAFKDENGADLALEQLKAAKKEHLIAVPNVAVLRKDKDGKLHVKEPTDMGAGRGAAIGGVLGGLTGLVFGPVGLALVGGAAVGGIIARLHDSGFKDDRLRQLGENLQPGTSAILAVIEHIWVTELEAELQKAGADVVTEELGADIAQQLKEGKNVAYTAVATDSAVAAARITSGPAGEGAAATTEASAATGGGTEAAKPAAENPAPATPTPPPAAPGQTPPANA